MCIDARNECNASHRIAGEYAMRCIAFIDHEVGEHEVRPYDDCIDERRWALLAMNGQCTGEPCVRPPCAAMIAMIDGEMRNRRSIRLHNYDYAGEGAYFITICTSVRQLWFGDVRDGVMQLNDAGHMVHAEWQNLAARFPQIELDTFIIMPDHTHGIMSITADKAPTPERQCNERPNGTSTGSIGRIVQAFKSLTTNAYIQGVNQHGWLPFPGKLWHRNYYEHIVRTEPDLQRIREYILHNPSRWKQGS